MTTFLKNNEVAKACRMFAGYSIEFWYAGKYRCGRIVDGGENWIRCEMVNPDAPHGFYSTLEDYETGIFRSFSIDKMTNVHLGVLPQPLVC